MQPVIAFAPEKNRKSLSAQTTTDSFVEVTGSRIDTADGLATYIGYRVEETGDTNDIDAELQGSIDGSTWVSLTARDETGSAQASSTVAVSANTDEYLFVTPQHDSGVLAAFRFYRVRVRATVGGSQGEATVQAFAK